MESLYALAVGPLAWLTLFVFVFGSTAKLVRMHQLAKEKDGAFWSFMNLKYGLRSIAAWMTPFKALGWKENPAETIATFVFHLCLFAAPVIALGHAVLLDQRLGIGWVLVPELAADLMTVAVLLCCLFFGWRRIFKPEVRYVTGVQDWVILGLIFCTFLAAFLAHHRIAPLFFSTLHILSGEAMLCAVPFTRLAHMLFGFFSRAYTGSEFGAVRHVPDW